MLYQCACSREVWDYVFEKLNKVLSWREILLGENVSAELNFAVSLICFILYKDWLIPSLENKVRQQVNILDRFRCTIKYWIKIYRELQLCDICNTLEEIIS